MAWSMATTGNAAMRKKSPFHVSIFPGRETNCLVQACVLP